MTTTSKIPHIPQEQIIEPRDAAAAALQALIRGDALDALNKAEAAKDKIYAYGCNTNPRHMGIIFLKKPQPLEWLHGNHWTSVMRESGERGFWDEVVYCQQCFVESGEYRPLRLHVKQSEQRHQGYLISFEPTWGKRFLAEYSRESLEEFLRPIRGLDAKPQASQDSQETAPPEESENDDGREQREPESRDADAGDDGLE